jgi:cyclophilin family peptidyl-prolyl cis-trans isomerase/protein-disulfide isomerase
MKKFLIPALLVLTLGLAACGTTTAETPTPEPTEAPASAETTQPAGDGLVLDADNPCGPYFFIDRVLGSPYPGLPEVTSEDYVLGPADAPVTFMVYSEPQCPYCMQFDPLVDQMHELYPEDMRFVFRLRPFQASFHDKSILTSQAMVAAGLQGKFDEFRRFIFERQAKDPNNPNVADLPDTEFWAQLPPAELNEWLSSRVSELGIDPDQLLEDMNSDEVVQRVKDAMISADTIGVNGTPTLFVNGYSWPENSRGVVIFSTYIELLKNKEEAKKTCPVFTIDTANSFTAVIETTRGDITIELFDDTAPLAVNSFVSLVESGWFAGLPILPSEEAIISGDPTGTGYGSPGYAFIDELSSELSLENIGMVALLSRELNRNGSVFFINKTPIPDQEGRTIFGQVTDGMDVVTALTASDTIIGITITES